MVEGGFLSHYILVIPALSWMIAQGIKMLIRYFDPRFDNRFLMTSGGMPSVHSAFIVSLTTAIGLKEGLFSSVFALAVCVSAVVLYDAMNIRYEGGKHAHLLNILTKKNKETKGVFLNEYLGHKPSEVLVGGILGVLLATLLYFL